MSRRRSLRRSAALVLLACGLTAAACTDGDSGTLGSEETTETSTTAPEATTSTIDRPATTTDRPVTTAEVTTTGPASTEAPATTATAPAPDDTLLAAIECDASGFCSRVIEAPSGAVLVSSPSGGTLRRVEGDVVVELSLDLPDGVAFDRFGAWPLAVGPDDVLYLDVPASEFDPVGDVLAVSTTGPSAGTVVATWPEASDRSGDTDYVPTAGGLVAVGCCGFDPVRPEPGRAPTIPWVDSTGAPVAGDDHYVTMRMDESANEFVVSDAAGARSFPLPTAAQAPRGMPWATPLADGGLVAAFFDWSTGASLYAVYDADDAGSITFSEVGDLFVHSFFVDGESVDGPSVLTVLSSGEAIVVRGRSADARPERIDVRDIGPRLWSGDVVVDGWVITVDGLNETIDADRPSWARSPQLVAGTLVVDWAPNELTTIEQPAEVNPSGGVTLVITRDGLLDDSVRAVRWTVFLQRGDDGLFRFVSGEATQQCQPGRGHQQFVPELCV